MRSLRGRLTLTYLAVTFLSTVVLGVCILYAVEHAYVGERTKELQAHADLAREAIVDASLSSSDADARQLSEVCDQLSHRLHVRMILTAVDGTRLLDTMQEEMPDPSQAAMPSQGRFGCHFCHSETVGARQLRVSVALPGSARAETLTLLAPTRGLEHTMRRIRLVTAGALVVTLLLVGVLGLHLASGIAAPVAQVSRMARRMAEGDLEQRVKVEGVQEVQELGVSFNEMAARIRRTLNSLAEEKSKLETVFAEMADGIIVCDSAGQIMVLNPACERIFAVEADTVVGHQVYGATFNPDLQRAISRAIEGETTVAEMQVRYPEPIVLGVHVSPFRNAEGATQGAIVVAQDRTEARRLADMQREFVANVSHELRTPVASIHATAETLLAGAKDDPTVRDRFIESLLSESERLSALLSDLLDLSRLDGRMNPPVKVPLCLREVVDEVIEVLRPTLDRRELNLVRSIPSSLRVPGDRTQITQVLANLVDNAVKYTPDGGEVAVVARQSEEGDRVVITISDTGIGIPPADRERIFERFYRVDKARSRQMGGTGLGLSIAREAVEAHGGTLTVTSEPGRGSTFSIDLPTR